MESRRPKHQNSGRDGVYTAQGPHSAFRAHSHNSRDRPGPHLPRASLYRSAQFFLNFALCSFAALRVHFIQITG